MDADPLTLVLQSPPPSGSGPDAVEVHQIWGDAWLSARISRRGDAVRIGPDTVFPCPDTDVPFTLVEPSGRVCTDLRTNASTDLGAEPVIVRIGAMTFVVRACKLPARAGFRPVIDFPFAAIVAAGGLMAATFALLLAFTPSRPITVDDPGRDVEVTEFLLSVPPPPVRTVAPKADAPAPTRAGGGGHGDLQDRKGGPTSKPGIFGALDTLAVLSDGDFGVALDAVNGLHKNEHRIGRGLADGDARGPGVSGEADTGGAGPGVSRVGTDPNGTPFGTPGGIGDKGVGVLPGTDDMLMLGPPYDRALIDEVVQKNLPRIRYCYQRELQKNHDLAGRIGVKFTIARDGTVSAASIAKSSMGSASVESCLTERFRAMRFPAPESGIVVVTYPFTFAPG